MKLILIGLLFPLSSFAAHNNYDISWKRDMQQYFTLVDQDIKSQTSSSAKCQAIYKSVIDKGTLNVAYALGYFDESAINTKATTADKLSLALDTIAFSVIRDFLTQPCPSDSSYNLCGFQEVSRSNEAMVRLAKRIRMLGADVNMQINLTAASASESYLNNTTTLASQQSFLNEQSKQNYFGSIGNKNVDVVFYNGHSRDGGGPDFAPPVLRKTDQHPDYGYYQSKRVGINGILKSMQASQNKNQIMGIFSCSSRQHFANSMLKLNPSQKIIVADRANDYLTATLTSMGYLEAIAQGSCGQAMGTIAKQTPFSDIGFSQIGL